MGDDGHIAIIMEKQEQTYRCNNLFNKTNNYVLTSEFINSVSSEKNHKT